MFCNKCGNKMAQGDMFCGKCGNKVLVEPFNQSAPSIPPATVQYAEPIRQSPIIQPAPAIQPEPTVSPKSEHTNADVPKLSVCMKCGYQFIEGNEFCEECGEKKGYKIQHAHQVPTKIVLLQPIQGTDATELTMPQPSGVPVSIDNEWTCSACGQKNRASAKECSVCYSGKITEGAGILLGSLASMLTAQGVLWIVSFLAHFLLFLLLPIFFGYSIPNWLLGGSLYVDVEQFNLIEFIAQVALMCMCIFFGIRKFLFKHSIRVSPVGIVLRYQSVGKKIVFLILSIFIGGLTGVVAAIVDLVARGSIMKHRQFFLELEYDASKNQ